MAPVSGPPTNAFQWFLTVIAFGGMCLASRKVGVWVQRHGAPLVTGYLFVGILGGPSLSQFLTVGQVEALRPLDWTALGYIAFAAASHVSPGELWRTLRAVGTIAGSVVTVTMIATILLFIFAQSMLPFEANFSPAWKVAVGLVMTPIMVARSPSSVIAVIAELRASGTFTSVTLLASVLLDVVVIILFSACMGMARGIFNGHFSWLFLPILLLELFLAFVLAIVVAAWIILVLGSWKEKARLRFRSKQARRVIEYVRAVLILAGGLAMFPLCTWIEELFRVYLKFSVFVEPLLVCMTAALLVNVKRPDLRLSFINHLRKGSRTIYVIFFTLTGASFDLRVFLGSLGITALLVVARLVAVMIGSFLGGVWTGHTPRQSRVLWCAFLTQAGVALGLAKSLPNALPGFGGTLMTMSISVIAFNQIIGPIAYRFALRYVGEAEETDKETSGPVDEMTSRAAATPAAVWKHGLTRSETAPPEAWTGQMRNAAAEVMSHSAAPPHSQPIGVERPRAKSTSKEDDKMVALSWRGRKMPMATYSGEQAGFGDRRRSSGPLHRHDAPDLSTVSWVAVQVLHGVNADLKMEEDDEEEVTVKTPLVGSIQGKEGDPYAYYEKEDEERMSFPHQISADEVLAKAREEARGIVEAAREEARRIRQQPTE